jgi:TatD DNase family protein
MLTDAHFHPWDLERLDPAWLSFYESAPVIGVASCHSRREFEHADAIRRSGTSLLVSVGVHPQDPASDGLGLVGELARTGRIDAIGECGFDLFDAEFAKSEASQEKVFLEQLELALRHGLPLVLHARKALQKVFALSRELKNLKAIVFHSWPGSPAEGRALLKKGINAYFSVGAQAVNGRRQSIASVRELPRERLLVETDAPYQKPRGGPEGPEAESRNFCKLEDIAAIESALADIQGTKLADFRGRTEMNFFSAFR